MKQKKKQKNNTNTLACQVLLKRQHWKTFYARHLKMWDKKLQRKLANKNTNENAEENLSKDRLI